MNVLIRVPLNTSAEQHARLCELRAVFARACNALAPEVQRSRVWNRVALHHLHYRALREQFPELGSQMVCNAIYAVSKMARLIYQHPASPYQMARRPGQALPLLKFADSCPVYFDRHTLSLKPGQLSLYTMDGRMRFELALEPGQLAAFNSAKLREVVLNERADHRFELSFYLDALPAQAAGAALSVQAAGATQTAKADPGQTAGQALAQDLQQDAAEPAFNAGSTPIPAYVSVEVAS